MATALSTAAADPPAALNSVLVAVGSSPVLVATLEKATLSNNPNALEPQVTPIGGGDENSNNGVADGGDGADLEPEIGEPPTKKAFVTEPADVGIVDDAVSDLNHCTQLNAWPMAQYLDITEEPLPGNVDDNDVVGVKRTASGAPLANVAMVSAADAPLDASSGVVGMRMGMGVGVGGVPSLGGGVGGVGSSNGIISPESKLSANATVFSPMTGAPPLLPSPAMAAAAAEDPVALAQQAPFAAPLPAAVAASAAAAASASTSASMGAAPPPAAVAALWGSSSVVGGSAWNSTPATTASTTTGSPPLLAVEGGIVEDSPTSSSSSSSSSSSVIGGVDDDLQIAGSGSADGIGEQQPQQQHDDDDELDAAEKAAAAAKTGEDDDGDEDLVGGGGEGQRLDNSEERPGIEFAVMVTCEVRGRLYKSTGKGASKKRAKQAAARQMLDDLALILGPVTARPTALIAGSTLAERYLKIVEKTQQHQQQLYQQQPYYSSSSSSSSSFSGGMGSFGAISYSSLSSSSSSNNSNKGEKEYSTGGGGDGSTSPAALAYHLLKEASGSYNECKVKLHSFFASSRGANGMGGMGQGWLTRRCLACNLVHTTTVEAASKLGAFGVPPAASLASSSSSSSSSSS